MKHETKHIPKHETKTQGPNKIKITLPRLIGVAVLIVVLYLFLSGGTPNYDSFAQCLSEKGAVMYGTYWCSHCKAQKADFGDSFQYVNYVECTEDPDLCTEKGIEGYPTWMINDVKMPGVQPLERLATITGCELKEG